ncbi:MAG: hypothetical protein DRJ40_02810 [Thermoprotei archaeon]|nr:MAG: hypothetical protein DRJ40_02810 [Thermoprotei archaeon]
MRLGGDFCAVLVVLFRVLRRGGVVVSDFGLDPGDVERLLGVEVRDRCGDKISVFRLLGLCSCLRRGVFSSSS